MDPLSAFIGGGLSLFGGLASSSSNRQAQSEANETNLQIARETNQARRELAEYAYQKDLEMWNRQNEYNSPLNQMHRLESAGLNPNLVYGNGSVTGNTSSSLPSYKAPNLEVPNVQSKGGLNFGDLGASSALRAYSTEATVENMRATNENLRQQNDNLKADADNKRAETENKKAQFEGIKADTIIKIIQSDISKETKENLIRQIVAETTTKENEMWMSYSARDQAIAEANMAGVNSTYLAAMNEAKLQSLYAQIGLTLSQTNKNITDTALAGEKFLLEKGITRAKLQQMEIDFLNSITRGEMMSYEKFYKKYGLNPTGDVFSTIYKDLYLWLQGISTPK